MSAIYTMGYAPQQRLEQIGQHLKPQNEVASPKAIPEITEVAQDSVGPRVRGKVAIVTGANSPTGIGRAAAHQFARNGALAVFICDYGDAYLATHERELKDLYPSVNIHPRKFDASDEAAVKVVVDEAIERYGRLDIFFANAGIIGRNTGFAKITDKDFMHTLKTNTLSVFLAVKYAAPAMMATNKEKGSSGGSIIATASVAGLRSNAGSSDYSASKAAVISLMQTCAWQLAGSNIRCNAICPGLIETGMTASIFETARVRGSTSRIGQLNPTRRAARADEVARMALFLGSDEASYVNGQAIAVCGGLSSGHPVVPGKLG